MMNCFYLKILNYFQEYRDKNNNEVNTENHKFMRLCKRYNHKHKVLK